MYLDISNQIVLISFIILEWINQFLVNKLLTYKKFFVHRTFLAWVFLENENMEQHKRNIIKHLV